MKYTARSFSVACSEGDGAMCREKGHSMLDSRGRCISCGQKPEPVADRLTAARDAYGRAFLNLERLLELPAEDQRVLATEYVSLEGGPLDGELVPAYQLERIGQHYTITRGTQRLYYRPIGVDGDSPRIFAFDGWDRG